MSEQTTQPGSGVFGDGVVSISIGTHGEPSKPFKETKIMADLPEGVAVQLMTESVGNIQANNRDGRNVSTTALGVLQGAMARNFDEMGAAESRGISGVLGTPIAGPTKQA